MIRKPPSDQEPQSNPAELVRNIARHGTTTVRAGGQYLSGIMCWGFALLWGFAAVQIGATGESLPSFLGVGAMAVLAGLFGTLKFAKARRIQSTLVSDAKTPSSLSTRHRESAAASEDQQTDSGKTGESDPDAIIARYLSNKAQRAGDDNRVQPSQTQAVPPQRQFGRKGL